VSAAHTASLIHHRKPFTEEVTVNRRRFTPEEREEMRRLTLELYDRFYAGKQTPAADSTKAQDEKEVDR